MNTFLDLQNMGEYKRPMIDAHKAETKIVPLMARIYDRGTCEQAIGLLHPSSAAFKRITRTTFSKRNIEYYTELGYANRKPY